MNQSIHCPKCASANIVFSKKRGVQICEVCQHEFTPEKPFVPKRIFLSYGHDQHASLAARLRDDLKARSHHVWFDEQRLLPGYDWEAFIEEGIGHLAADKANSAVVLLLTPHSVRRPDGYCLNEVARALSRGLRIIPVMVVESEPPLSICRIQWLDMRECIPIQAKEAFYQPKFDRLLKALEEDQLDFEGTQQRLLKALQPLEFDADILHHVAKFTGRQWVFDALQSWLTEPPKQRVFWICGGPGVGKTALSAVLSGRYREVAALHLCKFGHAQKGDPRRVVSSIAYQLTTQLPEYQARLAAMDVEQLVKDDPRTMFDNLFLQPMAKLNPPKRAIVILIDALDEATSDEHNALASFIATEFPKTPEWLRLVITSRQEKSVTAPLQALNPFILDTASEANRDDIRHYLRQELALQSQGRPDADRLTEQILDRSEGVFLYAERVCHDLLCGHLSLDRLDQFPQGLGGVFWQFFERQFPDLENFRRDVRPALRAILAAPEALPVVILRRLFGWQDEELRDFTRELGSLFPVTSEDGNDCVKPYHRAVAEWLTDENKSKVYFINPSEGHRLLAEGYCKMVTSASVPDGALISRAAFHLANSGAWKDLQRWTKQYISVLLAAWDDEGLIAEGLSTLQLIIGSRDFKDLDTDHYVILATQAGRLYGQLGNYTSAVDCLNSKALKNCSFIRHRSVCAVAIHELASLDLYEGNFEAAARGYTKALWLASSVVPGRLDEVAANCVGLATVRLSLYQFRRALLLSTVGMGFAIVSRDFRHAAASAAVHGLASKALGRIGTARKSFLRGLGYAKRSGSGLERARLLICLGWLALDRAVVEGEEPGRQPLEFFCEARKFARNVGDSFYECDAQLGGVWSALANDDLSSAIEATNSITRNYGDELPEYLELGLAAARGAVAMAGGNFSLASSHFTRVNDHVSGKQGSSLWKSVGLIGAGSLEWHSGDKEKAVAKWNQARSTGRSHSPFRARVVDASIMRCRASATEPPH